MHAEVIAIGDELLIGQSIDTNSGWIGEQLGLLGIKVHQVMTITDQPEHIISALNEAKQRAQIVILTGGLGPTKDDLTKQTLSEYFNTELIVNPDILKKLEGLYQHYEIPFTEVNQAQALLPKNCTILPNEIGTASGMWFEKEGVVYISLPGVPYEMKDILTKYGFPKLKEKFNTSMVVHKTIRTIGILESQVAEILKDWENSLAQEGFKLAYLPSPGAVRLHVSAEWINDINDSCKNNRGADLIKKVQQRVDELPALLGNAIYGYEKESIEEVVGNLLFISGTTLSTAESCTGGSISSLLTRISGSSAYFKGSVVSYANEVKINVLKVTPESLGQYGAVSQQVVEQMAMNVRKIIQTDYAISVSGVAGPTGGSKEKPVGTVWIAVASENEVRSKKLSLPYNHRKRNIMVSANSALDFLRTEFLLDLT